MDNAPKQRHHKKTNQLPYLYLNFNPTLTNTAPSLSTPSASTRCTNRTPSFSRSTLTHAHPASESRPTSSSLTRNRTNDSSGTTPGMPSNRSSCPLKSGSHPFRDLVLALYSPSFSLPSAGRADGERRSEGCSTCTSTLR